MRHVLGIVLVTLTESMVACGVSQAEHQRTIGELDEIKARLHSANKRIGELEADVARLSETDAAHWGKILDLRSRQQWSSVPTETAAFLDRWPGSPHTEQARHLRAEATESQADALLAQARGESGGRKRAPHD